jgi:predicted RNA-binding protein YlxR (DUF448 family)
MKRMMPMRLCVGCGERDAKNQLLRFSVKEGGTFVVGAGSGRGGYLHPQRRCVRAFASSRSGFVRSIGMVLSKEMRKCCATTIEQSVPLRP